MQPDRVRRDATGSATIRSSPRSLSHRQRRPVTGLNSCSCQPSPKPDQRTRRRGVELFDRDPGAGRRRHRHRVVGGRAAVALRERQRHELEERSGRQGVVDERKTTEGDRQAGPQRRIEASAADHQRAARRRRAVNPAGDRTTGWIAPVSVGDAGGFRRQRPAFADVPLGPVDAVPIHLVRARSAEQHRIRNGPAKRQRRRRAGRGRCSRAADRRRTRPARRRRRSSTSPPPSTRAGAATAASARRRAWRRQSTRSAAGSRATRGDPSPEPA